ncbi:MAG: hypothetical protein LC744_05045 [Chloroflexi bacterium]|nr:hypothetical protein [Chloroflexota bacterium]
MAPVSSWMIAVSGSTMPGGSVTTPRTVCRVPVAAVLAAAMDVTPAGTCEAVADAVGVGVVAGDALGAGDGGEMRSTSLDALGRSR